MRSTSSRRREGMRRGEGKEGAGRAGRAAIGRQDKMSALTSAPRRISAVVDSPIGPLTLVAEEGRLAGLYMELERHRPEAEVLGVPADVDADPVLAKAADQLQAYFDGKLTSFDLPLTMAGSGFQRAVWAGLQAIPYGQTISYGELARRIGQPSASRAV